MGLCNRTATLAQLKIVRNGEELHTVSHHLMSDVDNFTARVAESSDVPGT